MYDDSVQRRVLTVVWTEYETDFLPDGESLCGERAMEDIGLQLAELVRAYLGPHSPKSASGFLRELSTSRSGRWMDELVRLGRHDWRVDDRWFELAEILLAAADHLDGDGVAADA